MSQGCEEPAILETPNPKPASGPYFAAVGLVRDFRRLFGSFYPGGSSEAGESKVSPPMGLLSTDFFNVNLQWASTVWVCSLYKWVEKSIWVPGSRGFSACCFAPCFSGISTGMWGLEDCPDDQTMHCMGTKYHLNAGIRRLVAWMLIN